MMNLGSATRDDLVLDKNDLKKFLANNVWVEEKIDGANLGVSITKEYPFSCSPLFCARLISPITILSLLSLLSCFSTSSLKSCPLSIITTGILFSLQFSNSMQENFLLCIYHCIVSFSLFTLHLFSLLSSRPLPFASCPLHKTHCQNPCMIASIVCTFSLSFSLSSFLFTFSFSFFCMCCSPTPPPSLFLSFSLSPSPFSYAYLIQLSYEICFQNRSHYVTTESASQWKTLDLWKRQHQEALYSFLTPDLVLFGEWCYSKHSIHYTRLPDYFLAFDMYLYSFSFILFHFDFILISF